MSKIIGVRFRNTGKTYFFDPGENEVAKDDHVVVETAKGIEYGLVVSGPQEVEEDKIVWPLKPVLRKATKRDDEQVASNEAREKEAFATCQAKIEEHKLDMKLTEVEYAFDNSKILFYFTADGRVDFRELVKDLAAVFRTRIELRQIGVRDEARSIGGFGSCGRELCCATYLNDFVPVSIKMAKEQNLSLNPTKISGVCGRLMCCLQNEEEVYEELNRTMPLIGDIVATDDGLTGEVQGINVLRQIAKVLVEIGDDKELREYPADQFRVVRRKKGRKSGNQMAVSEEDFAESGADSAALKALEKEENASEGRERRDRGERRDKGERRDRQEKGDRQERGERQDKGERQEKGERQDKGERHGRGDKGRRDRKAPQEGAPAAAETPAGAEHGEGTDEEGSARRRRDHRGHRRGGRGRNQNGANEGGANAPGGNPPKAE